jgi:ribosomal protein L31E
LDSYFNKELTDMGDLKPKDRIRIKLYRWIDEKNRPITHEAITEFVEEHMEDREDQMGPLLALDFLEEGIERGVYELALDDEEETIKVSHPPRSDDRCQT